MNRLQAQFAVALVGVLLAIGVVLASLSWWLVIPYVAVVLVGLATLRSRARQQRGHTCTCCASTVHDPVQVR